MDTNSPKFNTEITKYLISINTNKRLENNSRVNIGELVSHFYDPQSLGLILNQPRQENNVYLVDIYWTVHPSDKELSESMMRETYQLLSSNSYDFFGLEKLEVEEKISNSQDHIIKS